MAKKKPKAPVRVDGKTPIAVGQPGGKRDVPGEPNTEAFFEQVDPVTGNSKTRMDRVGKIKIPASVTGAYLLFVGGRYMEHGYNYEEDGAPDNTISFLVEPPKLNQRIVFVDPATGEPYCTLDPINGLSDYE